MEKILEPVFLNEKMMLNTAAYLFQGYALKEEKNKSSEKSIKGEASIGVTFLSKLISPLSAKAEASYQNSDTTKSERVYTLGGLHIV